MNILGTQLTLQHQAFEVYLSGCNPPHCRGCHNPESWDFNSGSPATPLLIQQIKTRIMSAGPLVNRIWLLGGEPLDQPLEELEWLIRELRETGRPVWMFTRYSKEQIPERIKEALSVVKTGAYIPELASDDHVEYGVKLASTNQHIYRV